MSTIYRGTIKIWGDKISPGSTNGCRVAVRNEHEYFVASRDKLYLVKPSFPTVEAIPSKTGIPVPTQLPDFHEEVINTPLSREIQSIVYDEPSGDPTKGRIGAIDSRANVCIVPTNGTQYTLAPVGRTIEDGWAGLAFNPQDPNQLVTSHMFGKSITVWDGDKVVRQQHVPNYPTSISVHPTLNLILSLEHNLLAIYDPRDKVSCVKRISASNDWLYSIGVGADGSIGIGGATRTLTVYDPRKWAVRAAWPSCLKHEIRSIHFSHADPSLCYVGGLDAEVIAGQWAGSGGGADHFTCLRVDSRWIGLAIDPHRDSLFGCTASGAAYFIKDARKLYITRKDAQPTPHHQLDVE